MAKHLVAMYDDHDIVLRVRELGQQCGDGKGFEHRTEQAIIDAMKSLRDEVAAPCLPDVVNKQLQEQQNG